ncbi:MAG: ABC transporter ATP-binding protein [Methylobacteriaceae bacterium]|nr:ABC transporter ATP-binding protein [Methylobacteriaceae bacterium]
MIQVQNVTKIYPVAHGRRLVLDDASIDLPGDRNIGLLGVNGAGKSTLLRLIAGTELPTHGRVLREGAVSWPIGFTGSFNGSSTGRANVKFIARIYGRDIDRAIEFVEDFSELGPYFDQPVKTYSSGMRARLAFGVSMAIDFNTYLVDEVTAVGDARFAEKCAAEFRARSAHANIIMVSHSAATLREYCQSAALIAFGKIFYFADVEDGLRAYDDVLRFS